MKINFLDKYGYPVERIIGKPFNYIFRVLIHTRKISFGSHQYKFQGGCRKDNGNHKN